MQAQVDASEGRIRGLTNRLAELEAHKTALKHASTEEVGKAKTEYAAQAEALGSLHEG